MKQLFLSLLVFTFLLGSLASSLPLQNKSSRILVENPAQQEKRCEKCSRGADGKMVCVPIPCPK